MNGAQVPQNLVVQQRYADSVLRDKAVTIGRELRAPLVRSGGDVIDVKNLRPRTVHLLAAIAAAYAGVPGAGMVQK